MESKKGDEQVMAADEHIGYTVIITDSGFGGLSVLAEVYERVKHVRFSRPVNLFFVEALPKNCQGYPWNGYSLMPDRDTRVQVLDNVLTGVTKSFHPSMIAVVCNTLSVILKDTAFYKSCPGMFIDVVDAGMNALKNVSFQNDAFMVILGTQPTIDSDIHRRMLTDRQILPENRIIPAPFPPDANYPLLIETEPESEKTIRIAGQVLEKALTEIPANAAIYVYLGCTHFGFVEHHYRNILKTKGFNRVWTVNPNGTMTEEIIRRLEALKSTNENHRSFHARLKVYSQFELTTRQMASGDTLIRPISVNTADALGHYTLKTDIAEPWKDMKNEKEHIDTVCRSKL